MLAQSVTPPSPDASATQVVLYLILSAGGVGSALAFVKGVGFWVAAQLEARDKIIAAKDAELARINTENDRRVEAMQAAFDLRYEALRREHVAADRAARDELLSIIREGTHSGTGSSKEKPA